MLLSPYLYKTRLASWHLWLLSQSLLDAGKLPECWSNDVCKNVCELQAANTYSRAPPFMHTDDLPSENRGTISLGSCSSRCSASVWLASFDSPGSVARTRRAMASYCAAPMPE
ncbi:hypothetical protein J3F83DRAFT_732579 [Trichoderma novae-zelandiae]